MYGSVNSEVSSDAVSLETGSPPSLKLKLGLSSSDEQRDLAFRDASENRASPQIHSGMKRVGPENTDPRASKRIATPALAKTEDPFTAAMQNASQQHRKSEKEKQALQFKVLELEKALNTMASALEEHQTRRTMVDEKKATLEIELQHERECHRVDLETTKAETERLEDRIATLLTEKRTVEDTVRAKDDVIATLSGRNDAPSKDLDEQKREREFPE
ncbi:hypothetical protein BU23DRAFT_183233 [Bimuria novae-zelandiae CBS 107.79]|uniref:Uncharacterized protein n=1 Tax=Bimuria novae-zelandiae CBS 107.79 TaxID=1447943 RepID=A0A6A5V3M5_9PLEO|nr:hypothetical protein BU23DRAFT_183233 [Bimuria novae-zelandiae CBS 107.79]